MLISLNYITSRNPYLSKDQANTLTHKGWVTKNIPWEERSIKWAMSQEWMPGLSKDGLKRRESIVSMGSLFIDIDDPTPYGHRLIEHVHRALRAAMVSHAIATSTNHLREKHRASGEVLPACPRLKILIPLSKGVVFNSEEDKDDWNYSRPYILDALRDLLKVKELDTSSLDVNRCSFRMREDLHNFEWRFHRGRPFDVIPFLRKMPPPPPPLPRNENDDDVVIDAAYWFFSDSRPREEWVRVCAAVYHLFGEEQLKQMTALTKAELNSFKRNTGRGSGAGSIIHYAREYGWVPVKNNNTPANPVKPTKKKPSLEAFNDFWIDLD